MTVTSVHVTDTAVFPFLAQSSVDSWSFAGIRASWQGWSVNSSSANMLAWLKGSSTESAIRKLKNELAASTAKRARLDSKLQEQREIEARARK